MTVFTRQRKQPPRFDVLHRNYQITVTRTAPLGESTDVDVTGKVVELFRRILELSTEEQRVKVKANARKNFGIEFG